ncbi:hypothetical protein PR048_015004 [Dryococelus australis]|uniref:Uncharacterized protein n=1 Tax=Dryococelus australis TaxID=614101 RepID=A0ABQ9HFW7_9NEOP|nr:hypothetical protein PR048_015004 [Dryococelus australis]
MRVKRGEYGAAPECEGGKMGDPRENPSTNGIARHDFHMQKSEGDPLAVLSTHQVFILRLRKVRSEDSRVQCLYVSIYANFFRTSSIRQAVVFPPRKEVLDKEKLLPGAVIVICRGYHSLGVRRRYFASGGERANRSVTAAPVSVRSNKFNGEMLNWKSYLRHDLEVSSIGKKESTMAFVWDPSQHSPGVVLETHGKPKSGWPDQESNPDPPEYESSTGRTRGVSSGCGNRDTTLDTETSPYPSCNLNPPSFPPRVDKFKDNSSCQGGGRCSWRAVKGSSSSKLPPLLGLLPLIVATLWRPQLTLTPFTHKLQGTLPHAGRPSKELPPRSSSVALITTRSRQTMRVKRGENGAAPECNETGDPREIPTGQRQRPS